MRLRHLLTMPGLLITASGVLAAPSSLFGFTPILEVAPCLPNCVAGAITGVASGREGFAVNSRGTVAYAVDRFLMGTSIYAGNGLDTRLIVESTSSASVLGSVGINRLGRVGYGTIAAGASERNAYFRYDGLTPYVETQGPPGSQVPLFGHVGGPGSQAGPIQALISAHIDARNGMVVQQEPGLGVKTYVLSNGTSERTVLSTSRPGVTFGFGLPNESQVNDNGHLAYYTGTALSGVSQLRRQTASSNGTATDVIANFDFVNERPGNPPAELNNRGSVAYTSTSQGIRPNGTAGYTTLVNVFMDGRGIVSYSIDGGSTQGAGSPGASTLLSLNDFNQVAFVGTPYTAPGQEGGRGLYIAGLNDQPLRLLGVGDAFMGSSVVDVRIAADAFSSSGQLAFLASLVDGRSLLMRADPLPGVMPGNPILPPVVDPTFRIPIYCGNANWDCATPRFIDPVYAEGYHYTATEGAPAFASVLVPAALPGGDHTFELLFNGQRFTLLAGQVFDFTDVVPAGVTSFSILGIDPSEMLDPTDPAGFVTGVTFIPNGTASFDVLMTPITTPVPEPATAALVMTGLVALLAQGRGRPLRWAALNRIA